jgi:hypothetical protein
MPGGLLVCAAARNSLCPARNRGRTAYAGIVRADPLIGSWLRAGNIGLL